MLNASLIWREILPFRKKIFGSKRSKLLFCFNKNISRDVINSRLKDWFELFLLDQKDSIGIPKDCPISIFYLRKCFINILFNEFSISACRLKFLTRHSTGQTIEKCYSRHSGHRNSLEIAKRLAFSE